MKLSNKYNKYLDLYESFVDKRFYDNLDFSNEAKQEMFNYETYGQGDLNVYNQFNEFLHTNKLLNGYAVGKRFLDISVSMWMKDIKKGILSKEELYKDKEILNWFLDKILN